MKTGKKRIVLSLVVSLILMSAGSLTAYSQPADPEVFGVVRITDPEGFFSQVGLLVDKVQPGQGAMVNGMVMGQLQMLLQNPQWIGMEKTGEFTVVVLNPMTNPSPIALVMPLTNEAEFVDVLKQAMPGAAEMDGIWQFGEEGMQQMFFAGAGSLGVLSDNADVVAQVNSLIDAGFPMLNAEPAVKGQLNATIDMAKVMTAFQPMIEQYSQMAVMGMSQGMDEGEEAVEGAEPLANVMQAEVNTLLQMLQQIEMLELGIAVEPDEGLRLMEVVTAAADSGMANFFAAQMSQEAELAAFLPADAALVASGSIELTQEFIDGYAEFSKSISAAAAPGDAESAEKMAQYTRDMMLASIGDFAMSMFSQSDESMLTVVSTPADPAQYKSLLQQYPDVFKNFLGMYENMGVDFDMQVSEPEGYQGGEILTMDLGFTAEDIPDPEGQEMFKALLGDEFAIPIGFSGDYTVMAVGQNARSRVEGLIDAVAAGSGNAGAMTAASFGLPADASFFMGLSVPKILKWASLYAPEAPENLDILDGPGLGMSASFSGSQAVGELVIPLAEMLAIKDVMMKVQGAAAQPPME